MVNILQSEIVSKFILPFLLVFFVVFAILEKTKLFGDGKKQINAFVAFVIGLMFVSFTGKDLIISNLILFLTISIVIVFVVLLIWGFLTGGEAKIESKGIKLMAGIVLVVAVFVAVLWATGLADELSNVLFKQDWSNTFWTSVSFIVVIAIALALVLKGK
ncbi:MAG: hypothetical protein Q8P15_04135 [Nanoarchaeota archaeon]|nr:hypothetical protein [Nanoarchaeota archaeon]